MQAGKATKNTSYQLSGLDVEILSLVHEYHFLTAAQITTLRYSKNSLPWVQTRLKVLAENKYLLRRQYPTSGSGNKEYIYYLSTAGQHVLEDAGVTGFQRVRQTEIEEMTFLHLSHVLAVNDVLIASSLVSRDVPTITLSEKRHDLELKKTPVTIPVDRRLPRGGKEQERITIIPDGWLDFRMLSPQRRKCICLELDRGTVTNIAEFKRKIRGYVAYALSEEYQELFGTKAINVVYATTAGNQRLQTILEWTEQELIQQRLEHEAALFSFGSLSYETDPKIHIRWINPLTLFFEENFFKPFQVEPVSLLWQL